MRPPILRLCHLQWVTGTDRSRYSTRKDGDAEETWTLALAMVLTPALAMAQKTSYDFDKTANFAGYKTYALKDGTKVGQPLIDDRIVAAIDTELAAKGFTKTTRTRRLRRLPRGLRQAEGHLDLQLRLRRRLRPVRLGMGRRLGGRHDTTRCATS